MTLQNLRGEVSHSSLLERSHTVNQVLELPSPSGACGRLSCCLSDLFRHGNPNFDLFRQGAGVQQQPSSAVDPVLQKARIQTRDPEGRDLVSRSPKSL